MSDEPKNETKTAPASAQGKTAERSTLIEFTEPFISFRGQSSRVGWQVKATKEEAASFVKQKQAKVVRK